MTSRARPRILLIRSNTDRTSQQVEYMEHSRLFSFDIQFIAIAAVINMHVRRRFCLSVSPSVTSVNRA